MPSVAGIVLSVAPGRHSKTAGALLCCVSCAAGMLAYPLLGHFDSVSYSFPVSSMLGQYAILIDPLSALMLSFSSVVYLITMLHLIRSGIPDGKYAGLANILFLAVALASIADSVMLLLVCWEMLTLSTFLMGRGADESVRWRYFVITHLGGLIIMTVFAAMWAMTGTCILSDMDLTGAGPIAAVVMIFLLFVGFGTKLGIMPFHAWMPDMYNDAPVHTVTLLSTVCSNVAVLLLFKSAFTWIGVPDDILLPIIILLGASLTAIWGAMESLIQTEPRRILAYSSMENMAMVVMCLALGMLFTVMGFKDSLSLLILVAAVFHTINHSFFKSLMLLSVGTVESTTGERVLERMGGLAKVLPVLSVLALVGTLSMAAIPPMNGFVSEWLMIKTVVLAGVGTSIVNLVIPLVVAVLGICGMMAAASYARLYGFMFLGRPRSEAVTRPSPVGLGRYIPLCILAAACAALGVLSFPVMFAIMGGICASPGIVTEAENMISSSLQPIVITAVLAGICIILYAVFKIKKKKVTAASTWDCGTELEPNMQYSSVGFTQPLVRVFHPFYGDKSEVVDDPDGFGSYRVRYTEPFIEYILVPIGRSVAWISAQVGKIQTGNIQTYLGYLLLTLIVVLLGARFA